MASKISFRIATVSEHDKVLNFLRKNFFPEEPLNKACPIQDDEMEEEFLLSLLPLGNIIVAYDTANKSGDYVGLACIGKITADYSKESWEESETTANKKWQTVLKLMSYIEAKSRVCERYGVEAAMHMHGVCVDKKCRGKSLGKHLFEEAFRVAKSRGYKLFSADCTSIYSAHIAQSIGMEYVSMVTYDEYNEKLGYKLFNPIYPNIFVKSFVKQL